MMPADFVAEVEEAQAVRDVAKLQLLGLETEGLPWRDEAGKLLRFDEHDQKSVGCLILFTGHRIDEPNRKQPRFPESAEFAARIEIRRVVERQMELAQGSLLGVSGGANGGDILFLEACQELNVTAKMLLALPPKQFVEASVGDWVSRFDALIQGVEAPVLAQNKKLPAWLSQKPGYDFWQRNNLWLIAYALVQKPKRFLVAALWDGNEGDGPGGTGHMVAAAQQHGAELIWIDSRRLIRSVAR